MCENRDRQYYDDLFAGEPDLLDSKQLCNVLHIGPTLAQRLLKEKHINSIHYLDLRYLIPKTWLIDFVMGEYYASLKLKYRV